ncbi:putative Alpha/Beta hydrolase protein [Seiridium cardinale]|uniref:feruloyl esterase n=1 Tax=Seiridium cardinale TaxID=138064 RepID=A0ABR2XYR2_9PEZI
MLSTSLLFAIVLALAAASKSEPRSACDADSPPIPLGQRHNVTLPNSNRTYMYFLPEKYDQSKANPLILSFHGASRTSDWQANLDKLTDPSFNDDHIVAYPQALQYGNSSTYIYWQGSPNATADDVAYVGDVLDDLEDALCIDKSRIFATGKSQGGGMVGILACDEEASQRIAAFAPVSGAFYTTGSVSSLTSCDDPKTFAITCNPGRDAIPVLDFHGGNDTTININGGFRNGGCLSNIREWVAEWVQRNNLTDSSSETEALNGSTKVYQYGSSSDAGLVTFVYDGDHVNHDWPATINNTDNEDHGSGPASFNASSMIMEFFAKYTLPENGTSGSDSGTSTTVTGADSTSVVTAPFTIGSSTAVTTSASVGTTSTTTVTSSSSTVMTSSSVATTATSPTGSAASSTPTSGASRVALSHIDGVSIVIAIVGIYLVLDLFMMGTR